MSKIALSSNPSGSGVFTISSPATNTDRTLVLPDEAGTIITTAGVPSSAMPAGSVLQVVQGSLQTTAVSISSTYVSTGLSASITPTSASSNILVQISAWCRKEGSSYLGLRLYRNASVISTFADGLLFTNNADTNDGIGSFNYLDSPSTTSLTTYALYFRNTPATGTVKINSDGTGLSYSTITLMEIAG